MIVQNFKDEVHVVIGRNTNSIEKASMGYDDDILSADHRNAIVITDSRYKDVSDSKSKEILEENHLPIKIYLKFENKKSVKKLIKELREIEKNIEK